MHINLAHALVTALLIFATYAALYRFGVLKPGEERRFNWKVVAAVAMVVFLFNLVWPA
ncbi:hypothetical protein PSA7680_01569 [Pseudoruegeria aquimaris]|uniref:Uncharacterized protein n=1 Tax=Pseudoruegeria aquimaris TaxID=393663 RepID=A0A1Y5S6B7_9RHOB|nr:hypothetical protein [Pseudoruegeria aquimaris]SLN33553.1 hypothetical protein PSA7680_01569 [Pseudoruegeria aquimaris]